LSGRREWALWIGGWALVAALVAWALVPERRGGGPGSASPLERLLGPVASLAASAEWVRFDVAQRRGDTARAYALAETALRIDPGDPEGWIFVAHDLVHERGSLLREPDPVARAAWIRAGLATLERGERVSRDPGALAFERGVVLAFLASLADEDRAWPASSEEAWTLAAQAFETAAASGNPRGRLAADLARAHAKSAR
jgi:hypothetical protein